MNTPRNPMSIPGTTSFLEELYVGRLRWDLISPFPAQDLADRELGDEVVAELRGLLQERVDPDDVERTQRLPDGLVEELQRRGYLKLQLDADLGGRSLSQFNTFRVIEAAATWCVPVALVLAIQNSVGVGPLMRFLSPGPLRDLVRERLLAGTVCGTADTEPTGAANLRRQTTATLTEDGEAYLLNGEKIHVGNAPIADLLIVSATVREGEQEHRRLFVVDTDSPGFEITAWHEFMGVKGFPNGAMTFTDVRVPKERMLVARAKDDVRVTVEASAMVIIGRLHMIVAPSLAIAKRCLEWSHRFVTERAIDGRPLGEYDEIQRRIAESLADTFAIEAIAEWSLLSPPRTEGVNALFEQSVAKNIGSVLGWRIAERTMSLLAGEGYETASSKKGRGVRPFPLERALRDVRNFRISGGIDFQLDFWNSQMLIFSYYYPDPDNLAEIESDRLDPSIEGETRLSERNTEHLRFAATEVRRYARACREISLRYQDRRAISAAERPLILVSDIANELLTMALVLARAARLADDSVEGAQELADIHCTAARHRLADLWQRLAARDEPDYAKLSGDWLGDGPTRQLIREV